jgi:cytochrome c peroxidase
MRNILVLCILTACGSSSDEPAPASGVAATADAADAAAHGSAASGRTTINPRLLRRFKPVRAEIAATHATPASPAMLDLGRMLFFDKRLSKKQDLSCNSCHDLEHYGVDGQMTSIGAEGKRGRRNSPTVYHAAGHIRSFWDGRAATIEDQAKMPITNPAEMAMPDGAAVVAELEAIPGYLPAFEAAFPGVATPITYDNVGTAIGAFERKLVTPSRWDRYLAGDRVALTAREVTGLQLFTDLGCITCHTGEFVGGSTFQKAGVVEDWPNQTDQGRFEVTRQPTDKMIFKVPSLRNVAKTAPYFHDGSAKTLTEAVTMMGQYQLGETLGADDVAAIVAWLDALTGELPESYIHAPALPPDR